MSAHTNSKSPTNSTTNTQVADSLKYFELNKTQFLEDLKKLARIPSVSFDGFPPAEVRRSAEAVADLMRSAGLENIELISLEGSHPYVYADWLHAPGKPTVLLYAHHDVQPIGNESFWKTPPFEPTEIDGRLFGRGTADDKAGVSVHVTAIASFLKTSGKLPLNVKLIIEGEEEIGSTHLTAFVEKYRQKLTCDAMILTDTGNFDIGVPALTVALRGLVSVDLEVSSLEHSVHSGTWGGAIPDPALGLAKILSSLVDESGRLALPEMLAAVRPVTAEERKAIESLPYDENEFRKQSSLLPGVQLTPGLDGKVQVNVQNWREPSVSVNAIEVSSRKQAANIIAASAWARLGVRLVPDMDPDLILKQLTAHIQKVTPWGLQVKITTEGTGGAWRTEPKGVAFDAAIRALEMGYGKKPVFIGTGGSIPFVGPLADTLGGVPALLIGVEDPYSNPHSENESLHLGDWAKSIQSTIYFYGLYGGLL